MQQFDLGYYSQQCFLYWMCCVFQLQWLDFDRCSFGKYALFIDRRSIVQLCSGYFNPMSWCENFCNYSQQCYIYRRECVFRLQRLDFGYNSEQRYLYRMECVFQLQRLDFDRCSFGKYALFIDRRSIVQLCSGYFNPMSWCENFCNYSQQCYIYRRECVFRLQRLDFGYNSEQRYLYRMECVFQLQRLDFDRCSFGKYALFIDRRSIVQLCSGYFNPMSWCENFCNYSQQCYIYRRWCVLRLQRFDFGYYWQQRYLYRR